MLENIDTSGSGLGHINMIAGWMMGTAAVLLVIGGVLAALRWASGKVIANSENSAAGFRGIYLCLAAALVLGSLGGAIQWTSSSAATASDGGVLVNEAGPGHVNVHLEEPASQCLNTVTVSGDWHRAGSFGGQDAHIPPEQEHEWMVAELDRLGAFDLAASEASTRTLGWLWHHSSAPASGWQDAGHPSTWDDTGYISRYSWRPDGGGGDCTRSNTNPAPGSEIEVIVLDTSPSMSALYIIYTIPVPGD
ncbi:hypothetical protein [Nesterenkonia alkaliphila]|uniref:Uncharacterized protein n=1 Tax=Nesterenkonia alkaliphila TaxID=1463631 RepID=A0A7K1UGX9_9MICC|nr:hypothetical protein [Nesterenkonia alkaliphila]MVT25718.1 hypothetical protein [Nesterenkonia alkaliphila]GFZ85310.1 hypothetical protein GCM10011359_13050 [Nesterenkonia alkaliphila]